MFVETGSPPVQEKRDSSLQYPACERWKKEVRMGVRCISQVAKTGLASWEEEESKALLQVSGLRSAGKAQMLKDKFRSELGELERK